VSIPFETFALASVGQPWWSVRPRRVLAADRGAPGPLLRCGTQACSACPRGLWRSSSCWQAWPTSSLAAGTPLMPGWQPPASKALATQATRAQACAGWELYVQGHCC